MFLDVYNFFLSIFILLSIAESNNIHCSVMYLIVFMLKYME